MTAGPSWGVSELPQPPTDALPPQALAGCRVAAVFMHYGVVASYCWLLAEGVHLHRLLHLATPERSSLPLYLGIGWGECALGWGTDEGTRGRDHSAASLQAPPCCLSRPGLWPSVCWRMCSEYVLTGVGTRTGVWGVAPPVEVTWGTDRSH